MLDPNEMTLDSWVVAGGRTGAPGDALNPPIVAASTFVHGGTHVYSRDNGTPTIDALEALTAGMECGTATAFSSGMAAVAAVFDALDVGASVAIPDDCYQGVASLAADGETRGRWTVERIATADTATWQRAVGDTDLVWLESPSNPLLEVADLHAICGAPRKPGNVIAVDNTFATPFCQRPLQLGADIAMHSATKFIGGHADLLTGILVTSSDSIHTQIRRSRVLTGALPGALEAYLCVRGARTLAVRLERSQATASMLAERLEASPLVDVVRYPGLASHPTHETARRVLDGFGAMISFDVSGGGDAADALCRNVRLITHATSLGGVESTIERRAIISGQEHLPASLLRLSIGCENAEDLWTDLSRALSM